MLAARAFSLIGRQAIPTSVCMSTHGSVRKSEDYALPRAMPTLSSALHTCIKNPSASQKALNEKRAPWSSLSLNEKVELYHIQFNVRFAEMNRSRKELKTTMGTAMFFKGFDWSHSHLGEALCCRISSTHLWRGVGGQTDQEDTRHEGQADAGLLSWVGPWQKSVGEIGACHSPI